MKKITKILLCATLVITLAGCGKKDTNPTNGEDSVISFTKNDFKITANELYDTLKEKYATNYLIGEIDTAILNEEYKTDDTAKKYVDNQIKMYKSLYGNDDSQLLEFVQNYGYNTVDEFKTALLLSYKRDLATKDYAKKNITDNDIKKYYDNDVYGDITIRHILINLDVKDSMTDAEKKEAQEKADKKIKEIYEKLDAGTNFKDVAKEYSDDSATKKDGGLVGTFSKKEMISKFNNEFEEAVRNLKVGNYTKKVVKSSYGYHVIYKEEQKAKPKLEEVKETIIDVLVDEALEKDKKLQYKAMIKLREDYGLTFNDDVIEKQYETAKNNWLYGKESN